MPKKSRQAHIPQQVRRRKARRPNISIEPEAPEFADEPVYVAPSAQSPVDTRRHRRLELLTANREATASGVRSIPGQLPTFARSYLIHELRQIALTASALLALIIVLAIIMR